MARTPGADLDPARLQALAENLGQTPEAIAHTLHAELLAARARIDAGLSGGDPVAVGDGAHAARNSALMVGTQRLLAGLRALEIAADAGDLAAARAARDGAAEGLGQLIEALAALGG
ncbi:MAG: hypothetical protein ACRDK8_05230 [Solirubrobacteraceae bacterium]